MDLKEIAGKGEEHEENIFVLDLPQVPSLTVDGLRHVLQQIFLQLSCEQGDSSQERSEIKNRSEFH